MLTSFTNNSTSFNVATSSKKKPAPPSLGSVPIARQLGAVVRFAASPDDYLQRMKLLQVSEETKKEDVDILVQLLQIGVVSVSNNEIGVSVTSNKSNEESPNASTAGKSDTSSVQGLAKVSESSSTSENEDNCSTMHGAKDGDDASKSSSKNGAKEDDDKTLSDDSVVQGLESSSDNHVMDAARSDEKSPPSTDALTDKDSSATIQSSSQNVLATTGTETLSESPAPPGEDTMTGSVNNPSSSHGEEQPEFTAASSKDTEEGSPAEEEKQPEDDANDMDIDIAAPEEKPEEDIVQEVANNAPALEEHVQDETLAMENNADATSMDIAAREEKPEEDIALEVANNAPPHEELVRDETLATENNPIDVPVPEVDMENGLVNMEEQSKGLVMENNDFDDNKSNGEDGKIPEDATRSAKETAIDSGSESTVHEDSDDKSEVEMEDSKMAADATLPAKEDCGDKDSDDKSDVEVEDSKMLLADDTLPAKEDSGDEDSDDKSDIEVEDSKMAADDTPPAKDDSGDEVASESEAGSEDGVEERKKPAIVGTPKARTALKQRSTEKKLLPNGLTVWTSVSREDSQNYNHKPTEEEKKQLAKAARIPVDVSMGYPRVSAPTKKLPALTRLKGGSKVFKDIETFCAENNLTMSEATKMVTAQNRKNIKRRASNEGSARKNKKPKNNKEGGNEGD